MYIVNASHDFSDDHRAVYAVLRLLPISLMSEKAHVVVIWIKSASELLAPCGLRSVIYLFYIKETIIISSAQWPTTLDVWGFNLSRSSVVFSPPPLVASVQLLCSRTSREFPSQRANALLKCIVSVFFFFIWKKPLSVGVCKKMSADSLRESLLTWGTVISSRFSCAFRWRMRTSANKLKRKQEKKTH